MLGVKVLKVLVNSKQNVQKYVTNMPEICSVYENVDRTLKYATQTNICKIC